MAAIPSTRTHEQIHHYFQLINPEIPEDRLRKCLEEHNYDTQRCEQSLRKVSSQYLYQHPEVSHHSSVQPADMEGRSVSAHPQHRRQQSHSVSTEPYSRGVPDGQSPSLSREGLGNPVGHSRSSTWEEQPTSFHRYQPTQMRDARDPTNLNVAQYPGRPVSPRYDSGAWMLPGKKEKKEVSTLRLNQPDLRRSPIPPEMLNPMQTQVLSPPVDHLPSGPGSSPRLPRNQRTANSESNANGTFSPMVPPWIPSISPLRGSQFRKEVCQMPSPDMREHCPAPYEPLDASKEEEGDGDMSGWIVVNQVTKPPPVRPQLVTSISSPVSPPVVHISGKDSDRSDRNSHPKGAGHKPELKEEHTSQKQKNDFEAKVNEKSFLQVLLVHQKTRFEQIQKRVEEARMDVETLQKEVADMEAELNNKRTNMPPSFPTSEAISKLRADREDLLIDVECLQRDIALHLARQRESQQSNSFYQNIQPNNPYTAHPSRVRVHPVQPSGSPEDTETNKWNCKTCTFKNHEFLTECEMCGKPRAESHPPLPPQHS